MKFKIILTLALSCMSLGLRANDTAYYAKLVNDSFTVPIYYNDVIQSKITNSLRNNSSKVSALSRYSAYSEWIENEFKLNGLPKELALMAVSNTDFNLNHVSTDGAVGVWPLSFSMAKRYDININSYIDQRKDIELSTQAAIRFTKELYTIYKDWNLTITAFKVGAIKVNLAIRKANNQIEFNKVYPFMDYESRKAIENYVTTLYFYNHSGVKYMEMTKPNYDSLFVNQDILLSLFSTYGGMTQYEIKQMNPVLKRDLIPGGLSPFYLNIKEGEKERINKLIPFLADSTRSTKITPVVIASTPVASGSSGTGIKTIYYTVKSGDNLGLIADCYDVLISDLKRWNGIRGTTIYAGKKLKVRVKASKYTKYKYVNGYSMSKKRAVAAKD